MGSRRWWIIVGVIATGVVVGVGLHPAQQALGGSAQIKVVAKEFAFAPKAITVPTGTVQFVVTNTGAVEHSFVIDALKVKSQTITPGKTVTFTAIVKAGTYQVYCDVPGHKDIGMVATLAAK